MTTPGLGPDDQFPGQTDMLAYLAEQEPKVGPQHRERIEDVFEDETGQRWEDTPADRRQAFTEAWATAEGIVADLGLDPREIGLRAIQVDRGRRRQNQASVTGEVVAYAALKAASDADQARRTAEHAADASMHLARRPLGPNDVVVRPFGWTPTGRLAELAARPDPDEQLSIDAARLVFEGIPKNTRETYARQWWKFVRWCGETGRVEMPASPATVIEYMNHLWRTPGRYGRPTAPRSVQLALAVIAVAHQRVKLPERDGRGEHRYGYVPPTVHPNVRAAMRGYRKQWLTAGHRPDTAYALPPNELAKMVATLDLRSVVGVQKAAILCVGYDMGGRRSELAAINMGDIELHVAAPPVGDELAWIGEYDDVVLPPITTEDRMIVHVPMSKTDQAGEGAEVVLYAHPDATALTCPVRRTLHWLAWRRAQNIPDDGPFLLPVLYGGPGPSDGRPRSGKIRAGQRLSGESFEDVLAVAARKAGLNDGVGKRKHIVPHSLRAGSATAAAEAGADTPALNSHFRWSPNGNTANRYARVGRSRRTNPVRRIWQPREVGEQDDGE